MSRCPPPALERIFNLRPLDQGRPISHVTHQLAYDSLEETAQEVLRILAPHPQTVEAAENRAYRMRTFPYRTSEHRIDGVVFTFVDLTGVKRVRDRLRRVRKRYELLVENVDEYAIFTFDEDGCVTSWNPGAVRLFGYGHDEILGQPARIIYTTDDREAGVPEQEMQQARQDGQTSDERWHMRRDGTLIWGSGVMTALYDEGGTLRGYAKVLRDNTERRQAAENLHQLNESLEQQVAERTRQVHQLASELTMAEQRERQRISKVLHDNLQQRLYGVQVKMTFVRDHAASGDRETLTHYAAQVTEWINEAITTTRQLFVDLSPPVLEADGLADTIDWLQI